MAPKRLIHDEFLVDYYIDNILPFVDTNKGKRTTIQQSLEKFNNSKYDFKTEMDSTFEFYLNLDSLSRSLRFLGASDEKIKRLLTVLKRLQELLFQIPYYRDHLPHQLRVYLIGCYMLHEEMNFFTERIPERYAQVISKALKKEDEEHKSKILESLHEGLECNHQIIYDTWSLAGLCHDLGYSVQGVKMITDDLCDTYKELIPELNLEMSLRVSPDPTMHAQMDAFQNCLKSVYPNIGVELADLIRILKEAKDHGVWGCFFITSKDLADKIEENIEKLKLKVSDLTLWDLVSDFNLISRERFANDLLPVLYGEALTAIALHNRPFLLYLSPFTMLLVISDTLQEWNRVGNINIKGDQVKDVYVETQYNGGNMVFESEIYPYDSSPIEFYNKISNDFQPNDIEKTTVNLDRIRGEFFKGVKFVVKIGPSSHRYTFSI